MIRKLWFKCAAAGCTGVLAAVFFGDVILKEPLYAIFGAILLALSLAAADGEDV